jgi:hypothetical protein
MDWSSEASIPSHETGMKVSLNIDPFAIENENAITKMEVALRSFKK